MGGHLGFGPGLFGGVIWGLAAMFWFVIVVIAAILVVLLARFLWFGTRAAKVYLEEHGRSSRFALYEDRPHGSAPDAEGSPTEDAYADAGATTPYPPGGWPDVVTTSFAQAPPMGAENMPTAAEVAADGRLPAWPPVTEPADVAAPPPAPPEPDSAPTEGPAQPRTPLRPRSAPAEPSPEDERPTE